MAFSDGVAALAAGNTVVAKPDAQTMLTATAGLELAHEEEQHEADEDHWEQREQRARQERRALVFVERDLRRVDRGVVRTELRQQRFVGLGADGLAQEGALRVLAAADAERVVAVLDADLLFLVHSD